MIEYYEIKIVSWKNDKIDYHVAEVDTFENGKRYLNKYKPKRGYHINEVFMTYKTRMF